jgi:hypothetical protein
LIARRDYYYYYIDQYFHPSMKVLQGEVMARLRNNQGEEFEG